MKIIKPSVELMKHDVDLYQFIERAGRVCYKSEDKITENSAKKFVSGLASNEHYAPLEHEYIYFYFSDYNDVINFISGFLVPDSNSYGLIKYLNVSERYISGSVRAWIEFFDNYFKISKEYVVSKGIYKKMFTLLSVNYHDIFNEIVDWGNDEESETIGEIKLVSRQEFLDANEPDYVYYNLLPHTIKFVADKGFLAEITRHRVASFSAESSRFCNYSQGKFNEEITVIEPCYWDKDNNKKDEVSYRIWEHVCQEAEDAYISMAKNNIPPEQARALLPQSLKTEVIVTATEKEWQHIINLRYYGTTGRPHPQMLEVMDMAYPILVKESEGRIK